MFHSINVTMILVGFTSCQQVSNKSRNSTSLQKRQKSEAKIKLFGVGVEQEE